MSTPLNPQVPCPYELWDGSYVLGALSPAERREYESHLDGCATCSRAVRDLAGLPGLLGRIGPEVFETAVEEPVPETLMPRLVRETRRRDRRRTWLTAGIAAAAAVVVTAGGVAVVDQSRSGTPVAGHSASPAPAFRQMTSTGNDPMTASLALTTVAWGTRLDLTCTYPPGAVAYEGGSYRLVLRTRDGRSERVATWNALPGKRMALSAATAEPVSQIRSVVLTHADGTPVARLAVGTA
jgi:anti-sigma-K factor RskA